MRCVGKRRSTRRIVVWTLVGTLGVASLASGSVITVEFKNANPAVANLASLNGSSAFSAAGLSFSGSSYFVVDSRLIGAGADKYGVIAGLQGGAGTPKAVITFSAPVSTFTINAVRINTDFVADAYDGSTLVGTFSATGGTGKQYVEHTFTGHITKFDFHDHAGYVAVGKLTYTPAPLIGSIPSVSTSLTPEPSSAAVAMLLMTGVLLRRSRRR